MHALARQFPASFDRDYEERLLALCASDSLSHRAWSQLGPAFFMAGLAVMLASVPEFDRAKLLSLAERLHPGSSKQAEFAYWLKHSPLRPSRFLPMLSQRLSHAA
jgi:hypothetical protein